MAILEFAQKAGILRLAVLDVDQDSQAKFGTQYINWSYADEFPPEQSKPSQSGVVHEQQGLVRYYQPG